MVLSLTFEMYPQRNMKNMSLKIEHLIRTLVRYNIVYFLQRIYTKVFKVKRSRYDTVVSITIHYKTKSVYPFHVIW